MVKAVEVFTPNDVPIYTYVERATKRFEDDLRSSMSVPKSIISISGPSKSGKTVLVKKVVDEDNIIAASGASVKGADDLWFRIMSWIGLPSETSETKGKSTNTEYGVSINGTAKIPLIVEGGAEGNASRGSENNESQTKFFKMPNIDQVVKELADSSFVIFLDDFHYIDRDKQSEIGRQIKEVAERGVRICIASVPHRSDDVVRSNTELRGRVSAIDTDYWTRDELAEIAQLGFKKLNLDVAPSIVDMLSAEAFGSPQLMQGMCLNFCFENGVHEEQQELKKISAGLFSMENVLERTSSTTDFSSMTKALLRGPRQRGQERKSFEFADRSSGDVYRAILLAIRDAPHRLSFSYDELQTRIKKICKNETPAGSSVTQALEQMMKLADSMQDEPVIEWDGDILDIVEPYFMFYIRCSTIMRSNP